jgi:hypothetical protein
MAIIIAVQISVVHDIYPKPPAPFEPPEPGQVVQTYVSIHDTRDILMRYAHISPEDQFLNKQFRSYPSNGKNAWNNSRFLICHFNTTVDLVTDQQSLQGFRIFSTLKFLNPLLPSHNAVLYKQVFVNTATDLGSLSQFDLGNFTH